MVSVTRAQMTAEEFFNSPLSGDRCELIDGEAVAKVAPKRVHASLQKALMKLLDPWAEERGDFFPEWSIVLTRQGRDWVPVPDLTYVSFERLQDVDDDGPCPIPADLAIEIISPGQTFGELAEKAGDYIAAGVLRVWVVDGKAQTITVFAPNSVPVTYRGERSITDDLFPELELTVAAVFIEAKIVKP